MPYEPPPELQELTLTEVAELVAARKLPPVEQWQPENTGDSHMRIAADGRWFHDGSEVKRPAMVRAFASLLMRDNTGQHWLVMPYQKLSIEVEDAAFIATDVKRDGDGLVFRLNTDDLVIAGPDNPVRAKGDPDTPAIYVTVRHGCEARLNRSTYAQLAEMALESDDLSVSSKGAEFSLVPAG
ncbi:hypothetical protein GCM10011371_07230 [Novosphingobium marinum]|uniref:DUF1285 domain-containing protein n=1 Tax=Novosphingobium marinum TaxID=1514948 RepID=A0A7Y9XVZ6_9SPHN|nr:DUF1285 domain-containing protein [Novosphingobium marinum]NYH94410.1 hypothetical protein [Novosphingobium marinum]GGC22137.1 hypothetical protein GCM10011371_07230 [Novosphingobium marinum]